MNKPTLPQKITSKAKNIATIWALAFVLNGCGEEKKIEKTDWNLQNEGEKDKIENVLDFNNNEMAMNTIDNYWNNSKIEKNEIPADFKELVKKIYDDYKETASKFNNKGASIEDSNNILRFQLVLNNNTIDPFSWKKISYVQLKINAKNNKFTIYDLDSEQRVVNKTWYEENKWDVVMFVKDQNDNNPIKRWTINEFRKQNADMVWLLMSKFRVWKWEKDNMLADKLQ